MCHDYTNFSGDNFLSDIGNGIPIPLSSYAKCKETFKRIVHAHAPKE